MSKFKILFDMKRMLSVELQNEEYKNFLTRGGFNWIRQYHTNDYDEITRSPTVGCIVEIFVNYNPYCVKINSKKGQKLINKVCYF